MEGLPKLPGIDFSSKIRINHNVSRLHDYQNGFMIRKTPTTGIGNEPLKENSVCYAEQDEAIMFDPVLTYGRVKSKEFEPFKPKYVKYDRMALTFYAFFKECVHNSPIEHERTRLVNIHYFLGDDTMTVFEPIVKNCGLPQGRLVKRGKIMKNNMETYTWKDLNIGIDIDINGFVYHITNCDEFTKDYLESQGIELNDVEITPNINPIQERIAKITKNSKYKGSDKRRRYLDYNGMVLKFDVLMDESTLQNDNTLTYTLYYFLEDDTISIKELHSNREGRDHFPLFLKRTKIPMDWKKRPGHAPSIYFERTEEEVDEYYGPMYLKIGQTIFIFGRRFLILDCDKFTRNYYKNTFKIEQGNPLTIPVPEHKTSERPIPDYLGLGTPEDSLASCYGITPRAPKKDVIKYLLNTNKSLRYLCNWDTLHPEDLIRKFILIYNLADDTIKIVEPPIKNSGIKGGSFLKSTKIKVPGCDPNMPTYYTPKNLYIGAILTISDHRFRVIGVDLFVYKYMQQHPELFTDEIIGNVKEHLINSGHLDDNIKKAMQECIKENQEEPNLIKNEEPKIDTYEPYELK